MTRLRRLALGLLLAALAAPSGWANILEVPTTLYPDISAALTAAQSGDTVRVHRGAPYVTSFTLKNGVILQGEETAGTTLTGAITWASGATLRGFTLNNQAGLSLTGAVSGTIENNIFRAATGAALRISGAKQVSNGLRVRNNTFFDNVTGLDLGDSDGTVRIEANIFAGKNTGINAAETVAAAVAIERNHFGADMTLVGTSATQGDPKFVNEPDDLHVTSASPCKDKGAYSGEFADPTPGPVGGVSASSGDAVTVNVTWQSNQAFGISVKEYDVKLKRGSTYTTLQTVAAQNPEPDTYTAPVAATPSTPAGVAVTPVDKGLHVAWGKDPFADGYRVFIATSPGEQITGVDVGDVSSYDASGLANGTPYFVSVASYTRADRVFAVTARSAESGNPESRPSDKTLTLTALESPRSAEVRAVPEQLAGFPPLENKGGCFITWAGPGRAGATAPIAVLALALLAGAWAWAPRARRGLFCAGFALLSVSFAPPAHAGWTGSVAGGRFYPAISDWSAHFGEKFMPEGRVSLGYAFVPQIEAGVDAGYREDKGKIRTSSAGEPLASPVKEKLTVVPVQAYLLLHGRLNEDQWLVPYVGGGYSRLYYRTKVDKGAKVSGNQEGYHGRVGLKVLLNGLDPTSARHARDRFGVHGTYLLLEAQRSWVANFGAAQSDLGGTSYFAGVGLEF